LATLLIGSYRVVARTVEAAAVGARSRHRLRASPTPPLRAPAPTAPQRRL
jgi:hypothetical protein